MAPQTVNERIAVLRKQHGNLSQRELGERIGCSQQHVKRLEEPGHKIAMRWALALSRIFGGDPFDFFQDDVPLPAAHRRLLTAFAALDDDDRDRMILFAEALAARRDDTAQLV